MAIVENVALLATQTWPQGDKRSPLGIWGARRGITGDASGGSIKTTIQTPNDQGASYVYNVEAVTIAVLNVVQVVSTLLKCRLLTNWPNVDPQAGVQGYATLRISNVGGSANFSEPLAGEAANGAPLLRTNDRYLLLYDPRPAAGDFTIIELEISENVLNTVHAFEAYGYFWDRSVLQAPGGPRFMGSG